MPESVFEMMKASAVTSIPRYRQDLAEMDIAVLRGMLSHLRAQPISPHAVGYLDALDAQSPDSYRLLSELETEDILLLHEGIQHCWSQIREESQKNAIRRLYQLIAAHFFVYHVQA